MRGVAYSNHSFNPVCGFSMIEQIRLCTVWPQEIWFGTSKTTYRDGWMIWICYSRALERQCLSSSQRTLAIWETRRECKWIMSAQHVCILFSPNAFLSDNQRPAFKFRLMFLDFKSCIRHPFLRLNASELFIWVYVWSVSFFNQPVLHVTQLQKQETPT